ncbi:MAG: amidohydrolase family protein, partial [Gammaproteobacteria bacterium]|nr:amidohydrolase family protein [Gammaproteobacteria bacterium]
EHASVVDADTLKWIAKLGLSVATQPNFIYERGDSYIADVQPDEHASLYLCRRLLNSGIPVVGSTDAPFGDANPWIGIQAATSRTTFGGQVLNQAERMNIDDALALYTSNPFTGEDREIKVGNSANFVLVDKNWRNSESIRTGDHVLATVYEGGITYGFDL